MLRFYKRSVYLQQNCNNQRYRKMKKQQIDILGISSASICLIHCMALPVLTALPFAFFDHALVDLFFACIGIFVLVKILRGSASQLVKIILGTSLFLILSSIVLELVFELHTPIIYVGGFGMILGHYLNLKTHKPLCSSKL